ncbi:hypothetical protein [Tenggerimyces flavus]|uniref:Uncharacterized protein n=1 Tax=Tenggerimyces flavus TaxID=1708749 RepID=A0ABV7YL41_9ACTN|nr:hypothetical protein [Tenggerimyces flavus]MBM7789960.1 hypothetical protein [Tenggerimyces flavus]
MRKPTRDAEGRSTDAVTSDDLRWFSRTFADLADPDVLDQAWTCRPGGAADIEGQRRAAFPEA